MKPLLLLCIVTGPLGLQSCFGHELAVPSKWGVYVANVESGTVRSIGDFSNWQLSPNGRFIVGGSERGTTSSFYAVSVVPTSGGIARRLERFVIDGPADASFRWSNDSARVRVEADRNDDGKNEFKTFTIGRASPAMPRQQRARTLSASAMHRLKARFPRIASIAFSPDGRRVVAYLSRSRYDKRDFDGGLWLFNPDGTGLKRLTRNKPLPPNDVAPPMKRDFWDVEPQWLPDGKRLAFRRTSFEDEDI